MRVNNITIFMFIVFVNSTCASYFWNQSPRRSMHSDKSKLNSKPDKPKHDFKDMPTQNDLKMYLKALQRVVDFSAVNKMDIDMNYAFGLFLINVNLKTVLRHRHMNIPQGILQPIRELVKKNSGLLEFFRSMVDRDKTKGNSQNKAIYSLFLNDTSWVERLGKYDTVFQTENRKSSLTHIRAKFGSWEQYTKRIFDWEINAVPGPRASDYCIGLLADCHHKVLDFRTKCVLPENCLMLLLDGFDAGYALTHRLLFIIMAHYGRDCDVFSHAIDKELTTKYCSDAFSEAQYIAMHQFGLKDLIMEEIALCSLEGHVEFLKRTWLAHALELQTAYGCFASPDVRMRKNSHKSAVARPWSMARSPQDQIIQGGKCNGHLTATASGSLAVAVSHIGLIAERLLYCGLLGHTQFLKQTWLQQIVQQQTNFGCFSRYSKVRRRRRLARRRKRVSAKNWTMLANEDKPLAGGFCHRHITSMTAGALAVAVKFLLQSFF